MGDAKDGFVEIAETIKGFQDIFSRYKSEKDMPTAIRAHLDSLTKSVLASQSTLRLLTTCLRELESIAKFVEPKMERGRIKRTIEAPGDIEDIERVFRTLAKMIQNLQVGWANH